MRPKSEIYTPKQDDEHPQPFYMQSPPSSEWRMLALYSPPHFLSYLQTSETQHYLERSCFGVLSRQISFWTFLEFLLTILACKLYASCTCCVNNKYRVHVYSVFVWILLDSLVAVTVTVCCFSFASITLKIRQICIICLWFPSPADCYSSSKIAKTRGTQVWGNHQQMAGVLGPLWKSYQ